MNEALYIIDGSTYLHAAFHARPEHAAKIAAQFVDKIRRFRTVSHIAVAADVPPPTFRDELYPDYKRQRRAKKTQAEREALARVEEKFGELLDDLGVRRIRAAKHEADDVIATTVSIAEEEGLDAVIVARDKDLCQLVGPGVRLWDGGDAEPKQDVAAVQKAWGVSPTQFVDYLAMVGDSTDGLPGIKNIGDVAAKDLLAEFGSMDGALAAAERAKDPAARAGHPFWAKRGRVWAALAGARATASLMRELVRLRRNAPVDFSALKELQVTF